VAEGRRAQGGIEADDWLGERRWGEEGGLEDVVVEDGLAAVGDLGDLA